MHSPIADSKPLGAVAEAAHSNANREGAYLLPEQGGDHKEFSQELKTKSPAKNAKAPQRQAGELPVTQFVVGSIELDPLNVHGALAYIFCMVSPNCFFTPKDFVVNNTVPGLLPRFASMLWHGVQSCCGFEKRFKNGKKSKNPMKQALGFSEAWEALNRPSLIGKVLEINATTYMVQGPDGKPVKGLPTQSQVMANMTHVLHQKITERSAKDVIYINEGGVERPIPIQRWVLIRRRLERRFNLHRSLLPDVGRAELALHAFLGAPFQDIQFLKNISGVRRFLPLFRLAGYKLWLDLFDNLLTVSFDLAETHRSKTAKTFGYTGIVLFGSLALISFSISQLTYYISLAIPHAFLPIFLLVQYHSPMKAVIFFVGLGLGLASALSVIIWNRIYDENQKREAKMLGEANYFFKKMMDSFLMKDFISNALKDLTMLLLFPGTVFDQTVRRWYKNIIKEGNVLKLILKALLGIVLLLSTYPIAIDFFGIIGFTIQSLLTFYDGLLNIIPSVLNLRCGTDNGSKRFKSTAIAIVRSFVCLIPVIALITIYAHIPFISDHIVNLSYLYDRTAPVFHPLVAKFSDFYQAFLLTTVFSWITILTIGVAGTLSNQTNRNLKAWILCCGQCLSRCREKVAPLGNNKNAADAKSQSIYQLKNGTGASSGLLLGEQGIASDFKNYEEHVPAGDLDIVHNPQSAVDDHKVPEALRLPPVPPAINAPVDQASSVNPSLGVNLSTNVTGIFGGVQGPALGAINDRASGIQSPAVAEGGETTSDGIPLSPVLQLAS